MRLLSPFLLLCPFALVGQNTLQYQSRAWAPIPRAAVVDLSTPNRAPDYYDRWQYLAPPPGHQTPSAERLLKDRLWAQRQPKPEMAKTLAAPAPAVLASFEGNPYSGSLPNDNHLAVSNGGKILSVMNTDVYVYDEQGNIQTTPSSLEFFGNAVGPLTRSFDPRALYDPDRDRFILVYLEGSLDSTNLIVVGFSQTNDPAGAWNLYALPGNPNNDGTWSDFPSIGISENDLFICVNRFLNNSTNDVGFTETAFWQVQLAEGYAGNSLTTRYTDGLSWNGTRLFNLCPAEAGLGLNGPEMHLLTNRLKNSFNDTILVLTIDQPLNAPGTPAVSSTFVKMDLGYGTPPEAAQPADTINLDTNDGRIQGAFQVGDKLHFAANSVMQGTGLAGVYYGIIDLATTTGQGYHISDGIHDLAYPDLCFAGALPTDDDVLFSAVMSSDTSFPAAVTFTFEAGEASAPTVLKAGEGALALLSTNPERWGDYTGIQRKYNEPGHAWLSTGFSKRRAFGFPPDTFSVNTTWIAEVTAPFTTARPKPAVENSSAKVFPNPAADLTTVEFTVPITAAYHVDLLNSNGQVVREILQDKLKAGTYRYSFNAVTLAAGVYHLRISSPAHLQQVRMVVR